MIHKSRTSRPRAQSLGKVTLATKKGIEAVCADKGTTWAQKAILTVITINGGTRAPGCFRSAGSIGRKFGRSANAVRCHLYRLRKKGLIEQTAPEYRDGIPTRWVRLEKIDPSLPAPPKPGQSSEGEACQTTAHSSFLTKRIPNPFQPELKKDEAAARRASSLPEPAQQPISTPDEVSVSPQTIGSPAVAAVTPPSAIPPRVRLDQWHGLLKDTPEFKAVSRFCRNIPARFYRRLGRMIRDGRINPLRVRALLEAEQNPVPGGPAQLISYLVEVSLNQQERQVLNSEIADVTQQIADLGRAELSASNLDGMVAQVNALLSMRWNWAGSLLDKVSHMAPWLVCYAARLGGLDIEPWSSADKQALAFSMLDNGFGCEKLHETGFDPKSFMGISWGMFRIMRESKLTALYERRQRFLGVEQERVWVRRSSRRQEAIAA